jgi:magnesium and cobalt transporter
MTSTLIIAAIALLAVMSLLLSTLTYAFREYSRARLAEALGLRKRSDLLEPLTERAGELAFLAASLRLLVNLMVLIAVLHLSRPWVENEWAWYGTALSITACVSVIFAVTVPHALALHAGESFMASFAPLLLKAHTIGRPFTKLLHAADSLVRRATQPAGGETTGQLESQIEAEILSVIEEGEKEGIVAEDEKEMIESVIEFADTTAGQVMTARPDIISLPVTATLEQIRSLIEQSGHSRIPIFENTLDQIVGVIYARDLIKFVGQPADNFDLRASMRKPLFIPETKLLRDLLQEFRLQKVHIAIVFDEYGGTAGLVTIEDVLEELVGDISDEHEPKEPPLYEKTDEHSAVADARMSVYDLNRVMGLSLPEDAGYDTLGGFVSTTMGRIPRAGESLEYARTRFTVIAAEPHRVGRVKIELLDAASAAPTTAADI